jgi:hypothetical protein
MRRVTIAAAVSWILLLILNSGTSVANARGVTQADLFSGGESETTGPLALRPIAAGPVDRRRQQPSETALGRFVNAQSAAEAEAAAQELVATGMSFDEVYKRLKNGRTYSRNVPTGVVETSHRVKDQEFPYLLDVPLKYDPAIRYQVRFQLHGGIGRREDNRKSNSGESALLRGAEQIYVMPRAWIDFPWWSTAQVENLHAILDIVKRTYNVDENRVVLSGVSDGGTGSFYVAMRDTTPYASILPFIGSMLALASRDFGLGDLFPHNLVNKPLFVIAAGHDPGFPAAIITPVISYLRLGGVSVVYHPLPNAAHNIEWWPDEKASVEEFVHAHPRRPLPDTLSWQRGVDDPFSRAHWLVIDKIAATEAEPLTPDLNLIPPPPTLQFGMRLAGTGVPAMLPGENAARVTYVAPNSNAAILGLKTADVIVRINHRVMASDVDFAQELNLCCKDGEPITLAVLRNGAMVELQGTYSPGNVDRPVRLFPRRRPVGRVDLVKTGNIVRARTTGVSEYTLLLSPDTFDFSKPVTIVTNDAVSFQGRVSRNVSTLLKWAAVDNDRTMLFGAEVHVLVN